MSVRGSRQHAYHDRKPWVRHVSWARRRCSSDDPRWKCHRGLDAPITASEAEELWRREGAGQMKRPSLDRIDTTKGYTKDNCRFMEWMENVRRPHEAKGQPEDSAPEFT